MLRIGRDHGKRHDFGRLRRRSRRHGLRLDVGLRDFERCLGPFLVLLLVLLETHFDVTQYSEAGFRVVQHVPRFGPPGLHRSM